MVGAGACRTGAVLALVLALAGCGGLGGGPAGPPPPTLSGRVLAFVADTSTVVEIELPDGIPTPVVTDAADADVSPDGDHLAYVTKDGRIRVRALADGSERQVEPALGARVLDAEPGCLSFSPDGQRLAFLARQGDGLYVTTLDGAATQVDLIKRETYAEGLFTSLLAPYDSSGRRISVISTLSCGLWLDARRLVFDRVATMPSSISVKPGEQPRPVPVDTTTVALVDGPVRLLDAKRRWRIADRCGDYVMATVDLGYDRFVFDATLLPDDGVPVGRMLPGAGHAFVDGSCDVLVSALPGRGASHPMQRYRVADGTVQDLPPMRVDDPEPPIIAPGTVVWSPARDAYAVSDDPAGPDVTFVDLATGGTTVRSAGAPVTRMLVGCRPGPVDGRSTPDGDLRRELRLLP